MARIDRPVLYPLRTNISILVGPSRRRSGTLSFQPSHRFQEPQLIRQIAPCNIAGRIPVDLCYAGLHRMTATLPWTILQKIDSTGRVFCALRHDGERAPVLPLFCFCHEYQVARWLTSADVCRSENSMNVMENAYNRNQI